MFGKDILKGIAVRFLELIAWSAIPSVIMVLLNIKGILSTSDGEIFAGYLIGVVIFFALNVKFQRDYFLGVMGDMSLYNMTLISYGVFILLTFVVYEFANPTYVVLFGITKFLSYSGIKNFNDIGSMVIFHIAGLLMIKFSNFGLNRVIEQVKFEMEAEEDTLE